MKVFAIIPFLLVSFHLYAQKFQQYRWKNRLLVIIDQEEITNSRIEQLKLLRADQVGLKERKLLVYQLSEKGYLKGLSTNGNWQPLTNEQNIFSAKVKEQSFAVYLIGLDGGIKMRKEEVVDLSTIFTLIDGMPMRRAELGRY